MLIKANDLIVVITSMYFSPHPLFPPPSYPSCSPCPLYLLQLVQLDVYVVPRV